jgi:hypothetical protein
MDVSLPDFSAARATADVGNVVRLIRAVTAALIRSADAEVVFTSLAEAYARHGGARCVVELSTAAGRCLIQQPDAHRSSGEHSVAAGDDLPTTTQPGLAEQLLSEGVEVATGADWFAVRFAVTASAGDPRGADAISGCIICRYPGGAPTLADTDAIQVLVSLAVSVLGDERRVANAEREAANLRVALASNREIGTAIGILMSARLVTQDEAFTLLRQTSQRTHRKLRDVATEVVLTGALSPDTALAPGRITQYERGML